MTYLKGWTPQHPNSYEWWRLCERANYAVLPYAGGWVDQPHAFIEDLTAYLLLEEYAELKATLPTVRLDEITEDAL